MMKKLTGNDLKFLGVFLILQLFAVIRFWDQEMNFPEGHAFSWMNTMRGAEAATACFMLLFVFLQIALLSMTFEDHKKQMYYLMIFAAMWTVPLYLTGDYFGAHDLYLFMIFFLGFLSALSERTDFLLLPAAGFLLYLSRPAAMPAVLFFFLILFEKHTRRKEKKYPVLLVLFFLFCLIGVLCAHETSLLPIFAVRRISFRRLAVLLVLLFPYLLFCGKFLLDLLHREKGGRKLLYPLQAAAAVLIFAAMMIFRDNGRALIYTGAFGTFFAEYMIAVKDSEFLGEADRAENWVHEHLPIPAVVILYAGILLCFYVFALDDVGAEQILSM